MNTAANEFTVEIPVLGMLSAATLSGLAERMGELRDQGGYGASDIGSRWPVCSGGEVVAHLSYNGRTEAMKLTESQQYNLDVFRASGGTLERHRFQWYRPGSSTPIRNLNAVAIRSLIKLGLIKQQDRPPVSSAATARELDQIRARFSTTRPATARELDQARDNTGIRS